MRKLLWIGSYISDPVFLEMQALGYRNSASYVSQKNILEGIEQVTGATFDTVGCLVFPDYPACPTRKIGTKAFQHAAGTYDVLAGYPNVKYVNRVLSKQALKREAKKWMRERNPENQPVDIFVYEMRSACLEAATIINRRIAGTKIHLIVPDLPMFMDLHVSKTKKLLKAMDWRSIAYGLKRVDDYVLYAQPMASFLKLEKGTWMQMEGSIHVREAMSPSRPRQNGSKKIVVMYSGYLDTSFGLKNLVKAFDELDDGFELWISGSGPAESMLKEAAESSEKTKFFGFFPTREELWQKQQQATMMVNMRDPDAPASAYCFPSKIFEYMLTGKPVLSCRLGGIPEAYNQYLILMESIAPEKIAQAIRYAALLPDKQQFGLAAIRFVAEHKNNVVQAKRIVEFVHL